MSFYRIRLFQLNGDKSSSIEHEATTSNRNFFNKYSHNRSKKHKRSTNSRKGG